ncbi:MAG: ISL3 family transposase [Anaerovoracaceae bacterium]
MFDKVSYPLPNLPRVLSIDEFKGNAGGRKYQCILADPVKRKVLDILPSKNSEDLITYFLQFPLEKRKQVQYLVMDMSLQFRDVMTTCFPNASVITDKFHVCRYVTWALENVRKSEQKKFSDVRRKYFKRSRWLLLSRQEKLTEEQCQQLENMLAISLKLHKAYWLKEKTSINLWTAKISTKRKRI